MMIKTRCGTAMSTDSISVYFKNLINKFFKILPLWENQEPTIKKYLQSLQIEMLGCKEFVNIAKDDSQILSLLSILQYFIDNSNCESSIVKREVFKSISICEKLQVRYEHMDGG